MFSVNSMNAGCYRYEVIDMKTNGYLGEIIDCAYVLAMEDSPRIKTILQRLQFAIPCRKVVIQYNKGYKRCNKPNLKKQKSLYDITDAYYHAFYHYKNNTSKRYERVMILEDDFIFTPLIKEKKTLSDIKGIISSKKPDILQLGHILSIYNPFYLFHSNYNFKKHLYALSAHCVIYSKIFIDKFTGDYSIGKFPYDHYDKALSSEYSNIWVYNEPLGVQPCEKTENSNSWNIKGISITKLMLFFIDKYKLHDSNNPHAIEKGIKKINKLNYNLNFLIWLVILVIIVVATHFIVK
jgi:hypothetical protein